MKRSLGNRKQNISENRKPTQAGFTLLEVLLVLVILVVLGTMVAVNVSGTQDNADKNAARGQVGIFKRAIDLYRFDVKKYPESLEDLVKEPGDSTSADRWSGPYLDSSKVPLDPWDNEYEYEADTSSYRVWSNGPDGQDGSDDDIASDDQA